MQRASLILMNGRVVTLRGRASAVACAGDRILAIGSNKGMAAFRGRRTEVVDLQGRLVLPAFIDAHNHFGLFAVKRSTLDLKGVASLEELAARVSSAASVKPAGSWIVGFGWSNDRWEARPGRKVLDLAAPGRPVALFRNDLHMLWASSEALSWAAVTADTPDPPGGHIARAPDGNPSGLLADRAMNLVTDVMPAGTVEELADAVQVAQQDAHRAGIAGITCPDGIDAYRAFRLLRERGLLRLRVGMCLSVSDWEDEMALIGSEGRGDAWLHWTHLKVFADGSAGSRTAYMLAPYSDEPSNSGICVTPPDELRRLIVRAADTGFGCAIHAIGDAANRLILDAFADTQASWQPKGLRPRVEHAQIIAPADLPRFASLGVIASVQPIHITQDFPMIERAVGLRAANAYPFRSLLDSGARLAFGSDCPVESLDVLAGLYAATTRQRADGEPAGAWNPRERITLQEAVAGYTAGAAWAEYAESNRGAIKRGMLADLVILSEDILSGRPETLLRARVEGTIVGGEWVYRLV